MFKNWVTTVAGVMAAVGSFPLTLATLGYQINHTFSLVMAVIGLLGLALLGVAAKGADQHSTTAQAAASTATVEGLTAAPAMVIAADKQSLGK